MSDLDRKLAEAAALAAKLKRNKWSTVAPEPRRRSTATKTATSVEEYEEYNADLPSAPLTDDKRQVLKEFIERAAATASNAEAEKLRDDLNAVLDGFESSFVGHVREASDNIDATKRLIDEARELYEEMRPRQFVLQQGDQITELGEPLSEATHYLLPELVKAVSVLNKFGQRKNVILKGPAGSGKSTAGVQVSRILGLEFAYIGQTLMPHQIEGYVRQGDGVYVETAFVKVFRDGGVLMLEEMDAWSPQATLVANPPLANGHMALPNGEMIHRHKDCVIIACANTWGTGATAEYVGRNKLDAAFLDRFSFKFDWRYDDALERAAAQNDDLVTKVQIMRRNAQKAGIKVLISPRTSIDCADMIRAGFTEKAALELNCLAELSRDQSKTILAGVELEG